jgi:succinate dehydrogenase hydrophobic anchor subunit
MCLIKTSYSLIVFNKRGFNHWIFQRVSALCFLSIVTIVCLTNNFTLGFLGVFILILHINSGLETLLTDYMHDYKAKIYTEATLDIIAICLVKFSFILLIYVN